MVAPLATSPGSASAHGDSEGNIVGCFCGSVCSKICYVVNLFYYLSSPPCLYTAEFEVSALESHIVAQSCDQPKCLKLKWCSINTSCNANIIVKNKDATWTLLLVTFKFAWNLLLKITKLHVICIKIVLRVHVGPMKLWPFWLYKTYKYYILLGNYHLVKSNNTTNKIESFKRNYLTFWKFIFKTCTQNVFLTDDVKKYLSCNCATVSEGQTVMSLGPLWAGSIGSPSFLSSVLPHVKHSLHIETFLQDLITELR